MGSTRAARRAGSHAANPAAIRMKAIVVAKVRGSAGLTPYSWAVSSRVACDPIAMPANGADGDWRQHAADDEDHGMRSLRSQRHAHADFVRALRHRLRGRRADASERDEQRKKPNARSDRGHRAPGLKFSRYPLAKRARGNGKPTVDPRRGAPRELPDRRRGTVRANQDRANGARPEHERLRPLPQGDIRHVANDSDDEMRAAVEVA